MSPLLLAQPMIDSSQITVMIGDCGQDYTVLRHFVEEQWDLSNSYGPSDRGEYTELGWLALEDEVDRDRETGSSRPSFNTVDELLAYLDQA